MRRRERAHHKPERAANRAGANEPRRERIQDGDAKKRDHQHAGRDRIKRPVEPDDRQHPRPASAPAHAPPPGRTSRPRDHRYGIPSTANAFASTGFAPASGPSLKNGTRHSSTSTGRG